MKKSPDLISPHVRGNIYFARCNAYLRYGLMFWDNGIESESIFAMQKQVL
jgi:hypothetical protein